MKKDGCAFCNFDDRDLEIYVDDHSYAIIPLRPINPFHTLIIPKEHYIDFTDLPDDVAANIFLNAKNISVAIRNVCQPDAITHLSDDDVYRKGYNLMEHYKFHIIPRFDDDNVRMDWGQPEDPGRGIRQDYVNQIKSLL